MNKPPGQQGYIEYDIVGNKTGYVLSSKIRKATEEEIAADAAACEAGKCPHNVIYDEDGFAYYTRRCFTCGIFRSLI